MEKLLSSMLGSNGGGAGINLGGGGAPAGGMPSLEQMLGKEHAGNPDLAKQAEKVRKMCVCANAIVV